MQNNTSSFLAEVADQLYEKHGHHMGELTMVFPNKRTGQVFKQCLAARVTKPIGSPQVLTLEALVEQLSHLSIAPMLTLVFELYQSFQALQPSKEPFERFYGWGAMLLQDFDMLDKYLIKAGLLFANLSEQKELELSYGHLTEAQKAAIRSFWNSFDQGLSTHQHDFLQLWELLPKVYEQFSKRLLAQGLGYEGLCYRTVCDTLEQGRLALKHHSLALVGFNALHAAEEKLFAWLKAQVPTDFYWDVDAYYMEDERQEAGYYLRAHQHKSYFQQSFTKPFPERIQDSSKSIKFFVVASEVGQAQVIGTQLQALIKEQGAQFKPSQTAIVLANEALLLPMLHALPASVQQVSATLGYPLRNTAIYQLLECLLALQVATSQAFCPPGYLPTQAVITILSHPHVRHCDEALTQQTISHLKESSPVYTKQVDLVASSSLYKTLFQSLCPEDDIIQYLLDSLTLLASYLQEKAAPVLSTEKEAGYQLNQQLSRLQQVLVQPPTKVALQDFIQLFRELVTPMQLSLNEESLEEIQVLHMWETRNLDFDNVFILGMNEGAFPASTTQGSFIPYNLRKGHGLPTADTFQASLDAYYFYRLLQRSQNIYITYSTHTLAGNQGEMSRYLWQLLYESDLSIERHFAAPAIHVHTVNPIIIEKDEQVLQALDKFVVKPGKEPHRLTPSALNTYLDCSLRFYFQYIAKLREAPQLQEDTNAMLFGSLLHKVMEALYTPLMQQKPHQPIEQEDIAALSPQVAQIVQATFAHTLHQGKQELAAFQGQHAIAQEVMTKLIQRILEVDKAYAPFELIGLEVGRNELLSMDFELDHDRAIGLRGIIDRVDRKKGVIRVLDYKTGIGEKQIEHIASLFDQHVSKRNKAAFQTLFYAWLFKQHQETAPYKIAPGIINTTSIFEAGFDPRFLAKQAGSKAYTYIEDITPYQDTFEARLRLVLEELLAPTIPFTQTEDVARCVPCPYRGICQRH